MTFANDSRRLQDYCATEDEQRDDFYPQNAARFLRITS